MHLIFCNVPTVHEPKKNKTNKIKYVKYKTYKI